MIYLFVNYYKYHNFYYSTYKVSLRRNNIAGLIKPIQPIKKNGFTSIDSE